MMVPWNDVMYVWVFPNRKSYDGLVVFSMSHNTRTTVSVDSLENCLCDPTLLHIM